MKTTSKVKKWWRVELMQFIERKSGRYMVGAEYLFVPPGKIGKIRKALLALGCNGENT